MDYLQHNIFTNIYTMGIFIFQMLNNRRSQPAHKSPEEPLEMFWVREGRELIQLVMEMRGLILQRLCTG